MLSYSPWLTSFFTIGMSCHAIGYARVSTGDQRKSKKMPVLSTRQKLVNRGLQTNPSIQSPIIGILCQSRTAPLKVETTNKPRITKE